ncbi:MAG: hypothetical protein F9B45_23600 [Phycisphaera sp. RhM]|nr:hypothetical protein [Phycisphaera sp. RhM]
MQFVLIPASGEDWKTYCERHGIEFQPVSSFYMQRSELSRLEFDSAFPENQRGDLGEEIHPSQLISSWVDAVRLVHALSARDSSYEYRLPTVAQWRYAYFLHLKQSSGGPAEDLEDMAGANWEFAVRTRMLDDDAIRDTYDPAFNSESFVLTGSPPDHEHSTFAHYASPTPATGDDGIDEYTGVRLVLITSLVH